MADEDFGCRSEHEDFKVHGVQVEMSEDIALTPTSTALKLRGVVLGTFSCVAFMAVRSLVNCTRPRCLTRMFATWSLGSCLLIFPERT